MFVLDPARPLDAETYTIKGMLRKKSIVLIIVVNFYDFANIFFFFFQQFYTRYLHPREKVEEEKCFGAFQSFLPREFRLEHA